MSSELKSHLISRPKRVGALSGCGTLFAIGEDQIAFVCANEEVLFALLKELMPNADMSGTRFKKLSIIEADEKDI